MAERKGKKTTTAAKPTASETVPQGAAEGEEPQRKPKRKRPQEVENQAAGAQQAENQAAGAQQAEDGGELPKNKKRKVGGAKSTPDNQGGRSDKVQDAQVMKPKKKKKKVDGSEGAFGSAPNDKENTNRNFDTESLYDDATDGTAPSYVGSNPLQEFRPTTRTGITELPVKDFFLILLLWSPRFFVPWISAWHEFNVFILADPDQLEAKETQLLLVDLLVFGGACAVSIVASIIADLASMRYYVYLILLCMYTLCPIAGGYVDVVLRSRFYDKELYNHWFKSIVLMRIALAIPFVFFPVQFTCIFTEKANMSRQAHYFWAAFFAFLEFVNAYIAFWVIPPKCPTTEWTQIVVWVLILALLYWLIVLTLTFSIIVKSMRYTLMTCLRTCGLKPEKYLSDAYNEKAFKDRIPKNLRLKKLLWFGIVLIPLVFSSFVFATLERFVPDEDWDKHYVLSATSMFYLGRIVGVVVMVLTLFFMRHGFKSILRIPIFRGDVLVLGLPHLFNILALAILAGRYATLSSLSPGDEILGPIPSNSTCVAVFVNQMFRNKTVCVHSDSFRPVKVRAFRYATREIYNPGKGKFNISLIPEPGAKPVVATNFVMHNCENDSWNIYTINLFSKVNADLFENETAYGEFRNKPRVIQHSLPYYFEKHPTKEPQVIIINNFEDYNLETVCCQIVKDVIVEPGICGRPPVTKTVTRTESKVVERLEYWFNYGEPPQPSYSKKVMPRGNKEYATLAVFDRPGIWYAAVSYQKFGYIAPPHKIQLDEYSIYILSFYNIKPLVVYGGYGQQTIDEKLLELVTAKLHKIAEIAAPDGNRLPSKRVLQRDKAIQAGMFFAGMSAGGLFVGIVYLFWMDPPFPGWQTTALAVFWTLMIGAAESPKVKLVDVGLIVSSVLLGVQIVLTCVHVLAALKLYTPDFNFRKRPD